MMTAANLVFLLEALLRLKQDLQLEEDIAIFPSAAKIGIL